MSADLIARAEAAEKEVERLTAENRLLQEILDSRPAINAALPDSYIRWSHAIYSGEALRALSALPPPVPTEEGGELKPCPFCSARGEELGLNRPDDLNGWFIRCYRCNIETAEEYTREEVVAAWNTRPTQAPQDVAGLVEEDIALLRRLLKGQQEAGHCEHALVQAGYAYAAEVRETERLRVSEAAPQPLWSAAWRRRQERLSDLMTAAAALAAAQPPQQAASAAATNKASGQSRQEGKQP